MQAIFFFFCVCVGYLCVFRTVKALTFENTVEAIAPPTPVGVGGVVGQAALRARGGRSEAGEVVLTGLALDVEYDGYCTARRLVERFGCVGVGGEGC